VDTQEEIGWRIFHAGVYDVSVTEAIFRLTDPEDVFLDVGANIGFMTSVALAAGAKQIIAFEPHPDIFNQLKRNVALWAEHNPRVVEQVTVRQQAISDKNARLALRTSRRNFLKNRGLATLEAESGERHAGDVYDEVFVPACTFTEVAEQCGGQIGVLKLDIEGHEFTALTGSSRLFRSGKVRDIVFEDHHGMHSKVSRLLRDSGYTIFGLNQTPFGPVLLEKEVAPGSFFSHANSTNFLATLDAVRAHRRMSNRGFICLRKRSFAGE
jgi:FkbM family methyltransferase